MMKLTPGTSVEEELMVIMDNDDLEGSNAEILPND